MAARAKKQPQRDSQKSDTKVSPKQKEAAVEAVIDVDRGGGVQTANAEEIAHGRKQAAGDKHDNTAQTATRIVGRARDSKDVQAVPNPDVPLVAGPEATKEEREAALASQRPSNRRVNRGQTNIKLKGGKTLKVDVPLEQAKAKLHDDNPISFRLADGKGVEVVDPSDVSGAEAA